MIKHTLPFNIGEGLPTTAIACIEIPQTFSMITKRNCDLETGECILVALESGIPIYWSYGGIPETIAPDKKQTDIIILEPNNPQSASTSYAAFRQPDETLAVRPIGLFRIMDDGIDDSKVIAVPNTPAFEHIQCVDDLPLIETITKEQQSFREVLNIFFNLYGTSRDKRYSIPANAWEDSTAAKNWITTTHEAFISHERTQTRNALRTTLSLFKNFAASPPPDQTRMASILNDHLNSPESLTAALIKGNDAAWQQYTQHPFFQHIINGTLLPHQFDFFLEQQLHYYEELKTMYAAAAENTALKKLGFNYQDNATMLNHDIAALKTRNNGFSSRKNKVISEYGRYYLNLTAPAVSDEEESQFAALLLHVAKLPCWLGYTTIALNSTITTNTPNSSQQWLLQYATIDELVSSLKKDTQASLLFNLCKPQDNELKILLAVFKKSLDYEQQFLDSIILHQAQRGMSR